VALVATLTAPAMLVPAKDMPSGAISRGAFFEISATAYPANSTIRVQFFKIPDGSMINYLCESHASPGGISASACLANVGIKITSPLLPFYEFVNSGLSDQNNFAEPQSVPLPVNLNGEHPTRYAYIYADYIKKDADVHRIECSLNVIYSME